MALPNHSSISLMSANEWVRSKGGDTMVAVSRFQSCGVERATARHLLQTWHRTMGCSRGDILSETATPLRGIHSIKIRLSSSLGRERRRERRLLHLCRSPTCVCWRARRSESLFSCSSISFLIRRKSARILCSTENNWEVWKVVGEWLVVSRGSRAIGSFVWGGLHSESWFICCLEWN